MNTPAYIITGVRVSLTRAEAKAIYVAMIKLARKNLTGLDRMRKLHGADFDPTRQGAKAAQDRARAQLETAKKFITTEAQTKEWEALWQSQ